MSAVPVVLPNVKFVVSQLQKLNYEWFALEMHFVSLNFVLSAKPNTKRK